MQPHRRESERFRQLMSDLAEIELEYRQERQAAGIRVARKAGAYTGRRKGTTKAAPVRAR